MSRRRKVLKLALAALGLAAVALALFSAWIETGIAAEPALSGRPAILDAPLLEEGGVRRLGPAWSRDVRGLRVVSLAGSPFDLGYQNGRFAGDACERLEDVIFRMRDAYVPSRTIQWLLRKGILLRQRALPSYVPEPRRLELLGLARAAPPDRHAAEAPLYHRIIAYHAVHDLAHLMIDSPFVYGHYDELRAGCTGFAACSPSTKDGHVLLARNFDFEAGRVFDEEKVVLIVRPDGGIPFVSVAWFGMAGAVTGVNREGIACALNASASDDDAAVGIPVSLVVREVLERARTLDEAVAIVRAAPVFVSDSFILASGKEGRVAVVERSPARSAVREGKDGLVLAANHFLAPEFAGDRANGRRRSDATTEERYARLEEVLAPLAGRLDPASAVTVLRDRRGPKGQDVGLGNRGAIDALIATHSVAIDATERVLWVSTGPHTLGRFVPIALDEVLETGQLDLARLDARTFPEDPLLASGAHARHVARRLKLIAARDALEAGDLPGAEALAEAARALDPRAFEPEEVLARVFARKGDRARAAEHARAALDRAPPYGALRAELALLAAQKS